MVSVSQRLADLRAQKKCALIPFITAGDPDLHTTAEALRLLDKSGADIIELGVPYSDPLADGPVIQAAATRALQKGTTLDNVLNLVREVSPQLSAPIVLFTYYNPIFSRGIETFLSEIASSGVKGLVVPDLPLEEADNLIQKAAQESIEVILLVAPTSPAERIEQIAQKSQGFIYLVSVTGVTGIRSQVASGVQDILENIRRFSDKSIGVGFGISTPEQAKVIKNWGSDAIIVGSAFVRSLSEGGLPALESLCLSLKQAIVD
jgi:tryptophan synthase alpha chain